MTTSFENAVVVITGASAGVGRATAHAFAKAGARLALIARDEAALKETVAELPAGTESEIHALDVADADAVFAAADAIADRFGGIDVWVNDAMLTVFAPVSEITPEEFRRVTEVTYLGFVHGTMAALKHMRQRDHGAIIQVGSSLSYRGIPLQSAYCGAKHAIRGFTDSLRCELLHDKSGVRISMVQLPGVNTPQFDWARSRIGARPRPVPPLVAPEVAANAILKAARGGAREYWLHLSTAQVIFGNMALPFWLDRVLAGTAIDGQKQSGTWSDTSRGNLFEPIHDLHRTEGRFGGEAGSSALLVTGLSARLAVAAAGVFAITLVCVGIAFLGAFLAGG